MEDEEGRERERREEMRKREKEGRGGDERRIGEMRGK